jgi:hypothetical protein
MVIDKFASLLPPKSKSSPSGWISFNAPCCQHRGHKPDTRKRAGVIINEGIVYNCFNCKYTTGWQPGNPVGEKFKNLCLWLGANQDDIKQIIFEALKTEKADYQPEEYQQAVTFEEKELPEAAMSIREWIQSEYFQELSADINPVIDYIDNRGFNPLSDDFFWSPSPGFIDRVILPFRWGGKIVGSTARKITDGKPKYISDQHPSFVYNFDRQRSDQKYVLVAEGPFDALSVNGVALLTNSISDTAARLINSLGMMPVVVPDQDSAGLSIIDRAIELGWSVSFPNWEENVKDCAEAVNRYGKLFTVTDIIENAESSAIKISVRKNQLQSKLSR